MIVVTGGELLTGVYPDGHTYFLTRTLRSLGLDCVGSVSVDDKAADMKAALGFAVKRADVVIVTGGLGPTNNDITRDVLSEFTGIALAEHPDVLAEMERRFRVSRDRLRANLRRQTRVPKRGTYLGNSNGSAVGLVFDHDEALIVALPGPPRELEPMVKGQLVPYLHRRFGTRLPGCSLTLRFVGLGQSQIDQTLKDHVPLPPDVILASQFEGGRVDFTFTLPNDTPADRARLQKLRDGLVEHLGGHIYAEGWVSLEERVVQRLAARGATLALAEAGSGGHVTAGLSRAEGADRVLVGSHVAPTEERLRRLLGLSDDEWSAAESSTERTELIARRVAADGEGCWSVAVGDVQKTADGRRFVELVVQTGEATVDNHRFPLRGSGELDHFRLTTRVLQVLWQKLR
jgi:nicotinamide-nucleotide amidase